jgi:hypothetical protein
VTRPPLSPLRAFAIQLALVLLALLATKPDKAGDFFEYGVTTIALARHGTPDVRAEDAAMAAALSPEAGYRDLFLAMREHIARGEQAPMPGLQGGRGGVYTIHFFAYSALAALPFRLLVEAGAANPFKAFQLVNLGALWLLGLVMFTYFGSSRRAFAALGLVMASGGILYGNWCSPEMLTASALLAGMILFVRGRPIAGGLLAGVAAMQNPSMAFFSLFAPLFAMLHARSEPQPARWPGWGAVLTGAGLQGVLALLPFAFGQWQWGRPSIIALYSTDRELVGPARLFSYYFDPNQGMILVIPGATGRAGRACCWASCSCCSLAPWPMPGNTTIGNSARSRVTCWTTRRPATIPIPRSSSSAAATPTAGWTYMT